jgi:predicted dehydrogenase
MIYKAAVIGCGRIGFEFDKDPKRKYIATHTSAYCAFSQTQLVSICDIKKEKLDICKKKFNVSCYTDFKEMLKKEKIDILSICTPAPSHYYIIKEAVKYPLKAIFCEKPLAENLKEAEEIVKLCKKYKVILQIDHQRRFDPLHIKLKNMIEKKVMGGVQKAIFLYTAGIKNTGSHMFDLLRFFFKEPEWVEAFFVKKKEDPDLDGLVKFKNGPVVSFLACNVKKYLIFELDCLLEKGRFILKNSGFSLEFFTSEDSRYFSGYKELKKSKVPFNIYYKRNFMVYAIKHLVDCIRHQKPSISSGEDGLKALRLIEASIHSAKKNGKRIYLS